MVLDLTYTLVRLLLAEGVHIYTCRLTAVVIHTLYLYRIIIGQTAAMPVAAMLVFVWNHCCTKLFVVPNASGAQMVVSGKNSDCGYYMERKGTHPTGGVA